MRIKKYRYFVGDFETTVYKGQTDTSVWASATCELDTEDAHLFHSIGETYEYLTSLNDNIIVYYHNLKFDGTFWLSFFMTELNYKQAYDVIGGEQNYPNGVIWRKERDMDNHTFKYSISDRGQWYSIIVKEGTHFIEFRDSLKLLPFSVKEIGNSFKTKHKKLDIEYEGLRYPGCPITEKEKDYIFNDVFVVKEALEFMFSQDHKKLTIGSCCLAEYTSIMGKENFNTLFPNMYNVFLNEAQHGFNNVGDWIHKSYKGGWCYLVDGKQNCIYEHGLTADVNSLYPSMMSSESGNEYPYGMPKFWTGNMIPDEAKEPHKYFFVRIKTRFYIKDGYLPFIQIKGSWLYKGTECLKSSDVYNKSTGEYNAFYTDLEGNVCDTRVELTLTMTDYYLFLEHYNVYQFEIIDGCYFNAKIGLFDEYIDKYKEMKLNSKGAMKQLAKLFLNNLYGKMASSTISSFKVAYIKEDRSIGFMPVFANDKEPGYIPIGSAITSYARNFTIRAAQKNYYGVDEPGFIYADTDSIHCDLPADAIKGIKVHDKNFCCWKLEASWDRAIFTRQKTYIEHVVSENLEPIDEPYYNVKCAGMPTNCKNLFISSLEGTADLEKGKLIRVEDGGTEVRKPYTVDEVEFLFNDDCTPIQRDLTDFKIGLKVPGKLLPKRIRGGVLLTETTYEMR